MRVPALEAVMAAVLIIGPGGDPAVAAGEYEGSWSGTETFLLPGNNTFNGSFEFEVVGDDVTSVYLYVAVVGSGCTISTTSTTLDLSSDPAPITNDQFSIDATGSVAGSSITVGIDGTFESAAQAMGSVTSSATSGSCTVSAGGQWEASLPLPDYQPDALVKAAGGSYVGEDLYSRTGKNQTASRTVRAGRSQTFFVVISNDGALEDEVSAEGSRSSGDFSVRYFDVYSHGRDVTRFVVAGNYYWDVPATSGNWGLLKVVVSVDADADPGTKKAVRLVESSGGDPGAVDAVTMKVTVAR